MFREALLDEIKELENLFYYFLEETQQFEQQEILPTEYNLLLFKHLINTSAREHGIIPFVCFENDEIIAVIFTLNVTPFDTKFISVCSFGTYVKQEYRNKNIATELTKYAFQELKNKGVKKVYGRLFKERDSSRDYFNKMGFENIDGNICKAL